MSGRQTVNENPPRELDAGGAKPARPGRRSCAGDWVEVRSKEEILATLDAEGRLEGMPFMPEMLEFCGKRIRVRARAHKTCDTTNPVSQRAVPNGVHLENARCSGAAHGGCQAACMLYWKEAWLKPADAPDAPPPPRGQGCTEDALVAATQNGVNAAGKIRYRCQATDVPKFSTLMSRTNVSQYVEDLASRNTGLGEMIMTFVYFAYAAVSRIRERNYPSKWRAIYDRFQALWGGVPYPRRYGLLDDASNAPEVTLNLQPGELVRVRSYEDILKTLDGANKNRGMRFDGEMTPYCGGIYRVRSRVEQFLDEKTGVMRKMRTPAVILEGVWCNSRFSEFRLFCPRAIYAWWREAWLERAPADATESVREALGARAVLAKH